MTKLINRDEAILELAKGNTVAWQYNQGSSIVYRMVGNFLCANMKQVGFDSSEREYSVYTDYVNPLELIAENHKGKFYKTEKAILAKRKELARKATQAKPTTKLNGQNKAVTAQLIKSLSEIFGVKDQVFKVEPVKLYRLGNYRLPHKGTIENLSEYFIDEDGDLYSKNDDTYFTKYGVVLTKLSNDARDNSLRVVNSLRAKSGNKVTIARDKLIMMRNHGELEDVTMLPNSVHMIHMPSGDEVKTSDFAL